MAWVVASSKQLISYEFVSILLSLVCRIIVIFWPCGKQNLIRSNTIRTNMAYVQYECLVFGSENVKRKRFAFMHLHINRIYSSSSYNGLLPLNECCNKILCVEEYVCAAKRMAGTLMTYTNHWILHFPVAMQLWFFHIIMITFCRTQKFMDT